MTVFVYGMMANYNDLEVFVQRCVGSTGCRFV